ncbi:unnamed protein product [Eruca vesicaria subsp. sativa]|uniref:Uncharacterized protein n=1 Tax=Eruca vesicaria subsp. sativa TaxID=29727 RepID=A0ABC8M3F7_ERUVS|nr:unnamed protein product [Eruca vesicaria subsp. sativa]
MDRRERHVYSGDTRSHGTSHFLRPSSSRSLPEHVSLARSKQSSSTASWPHLSSLPSFLSMVASLSKKFVSLLGQFDVQRFMSEMKKSEAFVRGLASRLNTLGKHLKDKSLYALGFCSELLLTPEDTYFLPDTYKCDPKKNSRAKFPLHNLTAAPVWLYVDKDGEYWDVPREAIDLASLPAESGLSYRLCLHHNSGTPKKFNADADVDVPPASLLSGLSLKFPVSYRTNMDLWRGITPKLETCKPYDIFLSFPHVSVSGIIGAGGFSLHLPSVNSGFMADALERASLTAQYGNFQKLFFDLTRFQR